ncbi:MAG: hypothetical protein ABDH21_05550 [bacterium]
MSLKRMGFRVKGSALLLALFMVAFISSIVGILYTYNKRILLISRYEKQNYSRVSLAFREAFSTIYLVNNFDKKFRLPRQIRSFSANVNLPAITGSASFEWQERDNSSSNLIVEDVDINDAEIRIVAKAGGSTHTYTQSISQQVEDLKNRRQEMFIQHLKQSIVDELKEYTYDVFHSFDISIYGPKEDINSFSSSNSQYTIKYIIHVRRTKSGVDVLKKYELEAKYDVSVSYKLTTFLPKVHPGQIIRRDAINQDGDEEPESFIYHYRAEVNYSINVNTKVKANLRGITVRGIREE